MLDVERIRKDFPILEQQVNGHPLVYLDNAATSQKPRPVIEALVRYYETTNANVHRGIHALSVRATEQYDGVRATVARHFGVSNEQDIVFTRNATESINLVARAWGDANVGEGDEIVLTGMEHHSNIVPWQQLAARSGATLRFADVDGEGRLNLDQMRALIRERTKLVAVVHMSNVLGTVNPVSEIAEMAHEAGALLLVDGAQSAPNMAVDLATLGADFFVCSSHKMLGPTGVGVLWAREGLLERMEPFLGGGDMISVVKDEYSTWADMPYKFEAGTPNIADVIAFGTAIEYLDAIGMDDIRAHEARLAGYAIDRLLSLGGVTIHGPHTTEARGGAVSFTLEGVHPHDVSTIADAYGVAIRAGHHCAQPLMRRLGVPATSRASFYLYNRESEVDALIETLKEAKRIFARDDTRAAV
ncbi:MAG: cysteine desulfurase [Dehalococcoidia bacterium]